MNDLEKARAKINEADKELARIFEKRMDAVKCVAEYKRKNGIKTEDKTREENVINSALDFIESEDYKPYFANFMKNIIEVSKNYQRKENEGMKVAFCGDVGAFAEITAKKIFPDAVTVPCPDFETAYKFAENGECDCAVLPIENSVGGDVGKVMDLGFFGNMNINGIYESEIIHNLVALPSTQKADIKTVISHPQALAQCSDYISKNGYKTAECASTALAAKAVKDSKEHNIAAIASDRAAECFGLKIIDSHINESNTNTTRFALFSRSKKTPSESDGRFVLVFTVKNNAGELGKAVSIIGNYGFNLRALKSRPSKELVFSYYFYAEGEGNINSLDGKKMLEELRKHCNDLKILGSFEKEIKL